MILLMNSKNEQKLQVVIYFNSPSINLVTSFLINPLQHALCQALCIPRCIMPIDAPWIMITPSKAYRLLVQGTMAVTTPVISRLPAANLGKVKVSERNDAVVVPMTKPNARTAYTDVTPAIESACTIAHISPRIG